MKTKPIVMIVTFIIMILLTPIIFSKLMNSRYDTMLLEFSQNGYKIKTLKEDIGYLKSERVLDVVIPGEKLGLKDVEFIEAKVKTYFKNLPVTNVYFEGKVKDIKLKHQNPLIENLAKKIEFKVITPDFKTYAFTINPIKYKTLNIDTIKGNLDVKKHILSFNTNGDIKENNLTLEISNLNTFIQKEQNFFRNKNDFNLNIKLGEKGAGLKNVNLDNTLSLRKNSFVNFKLSFKKLTFSKVVDANDFYADIKAYDFNKTLFKKAMFNDDRNLTLTLLANGFKLDINSSLKNLTFLGFNQGGINLLVKISVYKAKNIEDFEKNFKKYLAIQIKADMSKEFARMLRQSFPLLRGFLSVPPDKNGIVHVNINFAKGSIK